MWHGLRATKVIKYFIFLSGLVGVCQSFAQLPNLSFWKKRGPAPFTWTGAGGNSNWNNTANWSTSTVPTGTDVAHFIQAVCTPNCNATINIPITVKGIDMDATYAGSITQAAGQTITVGTSGWSQAGGTFAGSTAAMTVYGDWSITGGSFSHLGTITYTGNISAQTIAPGSGSYTNITISDGYGTIRTMSGGTMAVAGDLTLNAYSGCGGACQMNNGTFNVQGNLIMLGQGSVGNVLVRMVGSSNQSIDASGAYNSAGVVPLLEIASTGGTVSFLGNVHVKGNYTYTSGTVNTGTSTISFSGITQNITPGNFAYNNVVFSTYSDGIKSLMGGTLNVNGSLTLGAYNGCNNNCQLNNGTLEVKGDLIMYEGGYHGSALIRLSGNSNQSIDGSAAMGSANVLPLEIASTGGTINLVGAIRTGNNFTYISGTINAGTSTLNFFGAQNIIPGSPIYNNVSFVDWGGNAIDLMGGTFNIGGNLSLHGYVGCGGNCRINNGTLNVLGNLTVTENGKVGTASLQMTGGGSATISMTAGGQVPSGTITINKNSPSLAVTLLTAASFPSAGQDLNLTSGMLNMSGFNLGVNDVLTVGVAGTLLCNGGTLTYGSLVNNGTIDCPGIGFNWTGLGGNSNWNTAANWSGNAVPGASDVAIFSNSCSGGACNASINVPISVKGIFLSSHYTGTLTQAAGQWITVGTNGWTQAGGAFAGGDSAIVSNGHFTLSGGTFTSTSNSLTIGASYAVSGGSIFNHNGGTVDFDGQWVFYQTIAVGSELYDKVSFTSVSTTYTLTGTMDVNGLLTLSSQDANQQLNGGTILAKGDVSATNFGFRGSTLLKIAGTGAQTITGSSGALLSSLEIASTGSVNLVGTLDLSANFTYTSGTVNPGSSSVRFAGHYLFAGPVINAGGVALNNVELNPIDTTYAMTGTLTVNGTLVFNSGNNNGYVNGGTFLAAGDLSFSSFGIYGSTLVQVAGSGNQAVTGVSSAWVPKFEIASTGGIVSYSGHLKFLDDYTYTSGTVNCGTSTVQFTAAYSSKAVTPGPVSYHNVTWASIWATYTLTGTMTVNGTLTMGELGQGIINSGTLLANGDVQFTDNGYYSGTVLIKITGTGNQTVSGVAAASIPKFEIASTGGTVTYSGTLTFWNDYTHTSGTVDASSSTLLFSAGYRTIHIVPGSTAFNNVSLIGTWGAFDLSAANMTVNGTLSIGDLDSTTPHVLDNGTLLANGNVSIINYGYAGTGAVTFGGTTASTLSVAATANRMTGAISINKTGAGSVTLASNAAFDGASQDLFITAGTLDMAGFNLSVGRNISNSGTLKRGNNPSCGTLTQGGTYSGSAAICP